MADRAGATSQITLLLGYAAPIVVVEPSTDGTGVPQKLGAGQFDLDPETVPVTDGTARLDKHSEPLPGLDSHVVVRLTLRVARTRSIRETNDEFSDLIVSLIDQIEFSLQQVVGVISFGALDVTPHLAIGEQREFLTYAGGGTALGGRLLGLPGDMRWSFHGTGRISLSDRPDANSKLALARWWYLKAISAQLAIDAYLAYWTALEVLSNVDQVSVSEPSRLPCGHTVADCPVCNKSTVRKINGMTLRRYLGDLGVSEEDANSMWRLRQAVHGKNLFGAKQSRELERQVGLLRVVVFAALKRHLRIGPNELPAFSSTGGPVISWTSPSGYHVISEEDIERDQRLQQ